MNAWIATFLLNGHLHYAMILADDHDAALRCAGSMAGVVQSVVPASPNGADGLLAERLAPYAVRAE